MSDRFRRVFPLRITFSAGEQPTSAKLSAVSEQTRNGLALVEKAVGDIWTQSGDSLLTSYPLQIPNLARIIGENKYLNPAIYPMDDDFTFIEDIGDAHEGLSEFHLTYKPKAGTQATITVTGTNITGSSETDERDVDANGEYWVDIATGRFRSYQALSGDETITYTVDPSEWLVGEETLPSIIPDLRQADFTSCRISKVGDPAVFTLHLPPRQPLTLDSTSERPASYPLAADVTANLAAIKADDMFWQAPDPVTAFIGAGAERYRYALPKEIQDAGLVGGNELPTGYLYLYNKTTGTIIEDVVFTIPATPTGYTLEVSSDSFDFDTVDTADETEASYNATNLVLITCGAPVTRTLWTLMSALFMHKHEKGTTLDASVSHSDLDNINPPSADYAIGDGHELRYPTHLPAWFPSNWLHDTHTSLLSRAGSQGAGYERDTFNNAMLGHLVMAQGDTTGGESYLDATLSTTQSFIIAFGDIGGPSIYADSSFLRITGWKAWVGTDTEGGDLSLSGGQSTGSGSSIIQLSAAVAGASGSTIRSPSAFLRIDGATGQLHALRAFGGYGASGSGIEAIGSVPNGIGVESTGVGTGHAVEGTGSGEAQSAGVKGLGGAAGTAIWGYASGTGGGVWGDSVGGVGVTGSSAGDYGVVATGETASPAKSALRITPQTTADPSSPVEGDIYFDGTNHLLKFYNGTAWKTVAVVP